MFVYSKRRFLISNYFLQKTNTLSLMILVNYSKDTLISIIHCKKKINTEFNMTIYLLITIK